MASNVDHIIEIPGVYDGWSIAVISDPTYCYVNRWADENNPTIPMPGYERRFRATEEYIERSKVARGRVVDLVWR